MARLLMLVLLAGGCSNATRPCTSSSCTGCCDSAGQCLRGDTSVACGSSGSACVSCGLTGSCLAGACVPVSGSGGGQAGPVAGGAAAGGSAGGFVDAGIVADAGIDGGALDAGARFTVIDLDQTARGDSTLALAVHRSSGRIGVAYFSAKGTQTMAGVDDFDVKYVEVQNGVVAPPQVVRTVQRRAGIALVFDGTGQPIVSYLGGLPGFEPGEPVFWFQSDAVIARRTPPSAWTETVLVANGDFITCGNIVSDRGAVVGFFPAMAFDGAGKLHLAYRDSHNAMFPLQDFAGSDVELVEDVIGNRSFRCVQAGGNDKGEWGGHLDMAIGPGLEPVLVHDKLLSTTNGRDVVFQRRLANGAWTNAVTVATIANTMSGPSVAGHAAAGVAFAVVDAAVNQLQYWSNSDPMVPSGSWRRDNVLSMGSSGWFPSLAFSSAGIPSIAHYQCSPRPSVADGDCLQAEDDLRLATRVGTTWVFESVDGSGGVGPKLAFTSNDKRVIAYRVPSARRPDLTVEPTAGALKLAIER